MKRNIRACTLFMVILTFGCLAGQTQANDPDSGFKKLREVITSFRGSGEPELALGIADDTFSILRPTSRNVPEAEAKQRLASAKPGFPSLRVTAEDEILSYPVDSRVAVEESTKIADEKAVSWSIRTMEPVATFPKASWRQFVEFALANGLTDLVVYQQRQDLYGEMSFASSGPGNIRYGSQNLSLSDEFYETMRVSPDYPPTAGSNGFVVLIHDPHSDVEGRYDLIRGLDALFRANPDKSRDKVEFLVEGQFPERPGFHYATLNDRRIYGGGLIEHFRNIPQANRLPLIHGLLASYLVDTPLAFRLLYAESVVDSYAIDDNSYLKEVMTDFGSDKSERQAIFEIVQAAAKDQRVPEKEKEMVAEYAYALLAYEYADSSKMSDVYLVKQKTEIADFLDALAKIARLLGADNAQLKADAAILERRRDAYKADATVYRNALSRNEMMLKFIVPEAQRASVKLPIAFIGSYHTQGITSKLREKKVGYVVLEPRRRLTSNKVLANEKRFQRFLGDPDSYFAGWKLLNKGRADLTPQEVEQFHKPYIANRQGDLVRAKAREESGVPPSAHVDFNRLWRATQTNGDLKDAHIQYGDVPPPRAPGSTAKTAGKNGPPAPPRPPAGAFAYFDESHGRRRLVILDPESDRWRESDRYDLLDRARLIFPYSGEQSVLALAVTRHYEDKATGRNFSSVYQASSKRIYLVEAKGTDIAAAMALPETRSNKDFDIHLKLSEVPAGGPENNVSDTVTTDVDMHNQL